MVIRDPDFYPSWIPDPTTEPKEGENFFCPTIFYSHKYKKIVNILNFEQLKEFFWPQH
jgi:hypothetical protein